MLALVALAALWAALQLFRTKLDPLLARLSTRSTTHLSLSLDPTSLHLSTRALNAVPGALLRVLPRRQGPDKRRLSAFYDAGSCVVLAACIAAQGVLLLACGKALWALARTLFDGEGPRDPVQFVRRALAEGIRAPSSSLTRSAARADSLLLRPLVRPPRSALPRPRCNS